MSKAMWGIGVGVAMLLVVTAIWPGMEPATTATAGESELERNAKFYPNAYYPGTEVLGDDEMRVTALGTGMPLLRRAQASSSWLVELGNGEKFLFDVGSNSQGNFSTLQIPYRAVDKVFLSHLHTDHAGDLAELWIGGWLMGRFDRPLNVWGPSGAKPELGTKHFVDGHINLYQWDVMSRHGKLPAAGAEMVVHEFDHTAKTVIYESDGVTITSFPAYHIMEGPVSFRLDWNGLSFVFSGDTTPTQWFLDNAGDADLVIHETFMSVDQIMQRYGWDRRTATRVGTVVHSSPAAAGKVFSQVKPRMAVGYHFYNDFDTVREIEAEVRTTYDGPLTLAADMMVFNVTKDDIRVRMATAEDNVWPEMLPQDEFGKARRLDNAPPSEAMVKNRLKF
jgi:ribonuclease Z